MDFCIAAVEEALARHGRPDVFNTDQGSQFTSPRFVSLLQGAGVRVSMDVFIERLWRSVKYQYIYLHAFETVSERMAGLKGWVGLYNERRPRAGRGV